MSRSTSSSHKRGSHHGGARGDGGGDGDGGGGGGGGKLVKVAFARNQVEAEMIQGLLGEEGIPSVLKRARGFDAPEFLAAGPHDVLVDSAHARSATAILADTLTASEAEEEAEVRGEARRRRGEPAAETSPARLALWIAIALLAAILVVWLLYELS